MSVRLFRLGRVITLISAAFATVLLLWALIPNAARPYHPIDWDRQLQDIAGRPVDRVRPDPQRAVWVYPLEQEGRLTGGVVVAGTGGYRGEVLVASTVDRRGEVRAVRVIAHIEGLAVRRDLRDGQLDAVSGATGTAAAIDRGRELAVRAVLTLVEERL